MRSSHINIFSYLIEYFSLIFSSFFTYIIYDICDNSKLCNIHHKLKNNNILAYNSVDVLHTVNALVIILHIINEIRREISIINDSDNLYKLYKLSTKSIIITSIGNLSISSLILFEYSTNTIKNLISLFFHSLILIPILLRTYNIAYNNNNKLSAIFHKPVNYTTLYKKDTNTLSPKNLNNIVYPTGVYI